MRAPSRSRAKVLSSLQPISFSQVRHPTEISTPHCCSPRTSAAGKQWVEDMNYSALILQRTTCWPSKMCRNRPNRGSSKGRVPVSK